MAQPGTEIRILQGVFRARMRRCDRGLTGEIQGDPLFVALRRRHAHLASFMTAAPSGPAGAGAEAAEDPLDVMGFGEIIVGALKSTEIPEISNFSAVWRENLYEAVRRSVDSIRNTTEMRRALESLQRSLRELDADASVGWENLHNELRDRQYTDEQVGAARFALYQRLVRGIILCVIHHLSRASAEGYRRRPPAQRDALAAAALAACLRFPLEEVPT